jgi:hypothetical protein
MAAFCGCCGAEITGKVEACPVCGMPRHGMVRTDREPGPGAGDGPFPEEAEDRRARKGRRTCCRER